MRVVFGQTSSIGFDLSFGPCEEGEQQCAGLLAGALTTNKDVRWFVYSSSGVNCHRGKAVWKDEAGGTIGCLGRPGDLVGINKWSRFRATQLDNDLWDVRVNDKKVASVETEKDKLLSAYSSFWPSNGREELKGGFWQGMPHFEGIHWGWYSGQFNEAGDGVAETFVAGNDCPRYFGFRDAIDSNGGKWYTGTTFGDKKLYSCQVDPLF